MKRERADCCPPRPVPGGAAIDAHARRFKALGDPTRLGILLMLRDCADTLCACEIESAFDLSQPTISHHLRQLRRAGLIEAERRGVWMHFRLAGEGVAAIGEFARSLDATPTP